MRAAFFVDGFNLYHAIDEFGDNRLKWLSIWALGERVIQRQSERLVTCHYFSAFANHLRAQRPDVVERHKTYVSALRSTGVLVTLGTFKRKGVECKNCGSAWQRHEEKETDVNIAVAVVSAAYRDEYDVAYILSADTDLTPAMREVGTIMDRSGNRSKKVVAVFPPTLPGRSRYVSALQQNSDAQITLNIRHIQTCRLPDLVTADSGNVVQCPSRYR